MDDDGRCRNRSAAWAQVQELLRAGAEDEVRRHGAAGATLAATISGRLALLARLRPFPAGGVAAALAEVLALAGRLGCDGAALATTGRASWPSTVDSPDQTCEVLTLHCVDDRVRLGSRSWTLLWPIVRDGGVCRLGAVRRVSEASGPVPDMLAAALAGRGGAHPDPRELRRQAARAVRAGHALWLGPALRDRLLGPDER